MAWQWKSARRSTRPEGTTLATPSFKPSVGDSVLAACNPGPCTRRSTAERLCLFLQFCNESAAICALVGVSVLRSRNGRCAPSPRRNFFRTTPLVSADHSPGASARSSHHGGEQGERAGGGGGDESHPRQCKQPTWRRGGRTCMRGRGCSWRRGRQVLSCAHSLLPCSPSTHVLMLLGLLWHRGWPTTNRDRAAGHAQIETMWRIQLAPNHV